MPEVKVTGLRELRRALRAAGEGLDEGMRAELKEVALLVAERARSKIPSRSGRTEASIRPVLARGGVAVRAGGARVPWYGWLDFGGVRRHMGSRHSHGVEHLQPGREFVKEGRYLYPARDEVTADIELRTRRMLDNVFRLAGWED